MSTLTVNAKAQITLYKDILKHLGIRPGEKITVDVYPMKDGRVGGQFSKATLASGQKIDMMQSVKAFAAGGQTADGEATGGDAK